MVNCILHYTLNLTIELTQEYIYHWDSSDESTVGVLSVEFDITEALTEFNANCDGTSDFEVFTESNSPLEVSKCTKTSEGFFAKEVKTSFREGMYAVQDGKTREVTIKNAEITFSDSKLPKLTIEGKSANSADKFILSDIVTLKDSEFEIIYEDGASNIK